MALFIEATGEQINFNDDNPSMPGQGYWDAGIFNIKLIAGSYIVGISAFPEALLTLWNGENLENTYASVHGSTIAQGYGNLTVSISEIPEPTTLILFILGIVVKVRTKPI